MVWGTAAAQPTVAQHAAVLQEAVLLQSQPVSRSSGASARDGVYAQQAQRRAARLYTFGFRYALIPSVGGGGGGRGGGAAGASGVTGTSSTSFCAAAGARSCAIITAHRCASCGDRRRHRVCSSASTNDSMITTATTTNLDGDVCCGWCRRTRRADQDTTSGRQQPAAPGAGQPSAPIIVLRCLICTAALMESCAGSRAGHGGAAAISHALCIALVTAGGLLSANTACMAVSGGPLM